MVDLKTGALFLQKHFDDVLVYLKSIKTYYQENHTRSECVFFFEFSTRFECVFLVLHSLRVYFQQDDDFNWNIGLAYGAVENYKESKDHLLLIANER